MWHIITQAYIIVQRSFNFKIFSVFLIFLSRLYILKISKSAVEPKALPWREEDDSYVITAYFKDPSLICSKKDSHDKYIGDRLLIQNSSKSFEFVQVPLLENGLLESAWTEGECFWSMGELWLSSLIHRYSTIWFVCKAAYTFTNLWSSWKCIMLSCVYRKAVLVWPVKRDWLQLAVSGVFDVHEWTAEWVWLGSFTQTW